MKEPTTVPINSENLILTLLQALDTKVDAIQTTLATHEERSHNQDSRISRVERAGGAVTLALIVALFGVFMSGCGLFSAIKGAGSSPAAPAAEKVDVVARALENTIALQMVEDGRTFCSGVAAEGVFITAAHCVDEDREFQILYRGKVYPGAVTLIWVERDLAFVDAIGARMQPTPSMTEWEPQVGQKIIWTGYPAGIELLMGTGIVAAPVTIAFGMEGFTAVYAMFTPGNSGGPVWDEAGNLFGIVSSGLTYDSHPQSVGYVVSPLTLKEALKAL